MTNTPRTLRDRMALALKAADASQADLARAAKVSRATVSDWLKGDIREIKSQKLLAAAQFLRVRPEWLRAGDGPMRGDSLDGSERELVDLFRLMDDEGKYDTLKFARYVRTISKAVPDPPYPAPVKPK